MNDVDFGLYKEELIEFQTLFENKKIKKLVIGHEKEYTYKLIFDDDINELKSIL